MKSGIFFTGTGPILILTSYNSLTNPNIVKKLKAKGIRKFIAYEVQAESLAAKYGNHYKVVLGDLHQEDDLRVLDYNGHHIFELFNLKELTNPVLHEG